MRLIHLTCWILTAVFLAAAAPSALPQAESRTVPEFANVHGGTYRLPGPDEARAVVLIFAGHDCPISNSYSKEINRLCEEYVPKKIAFCIVYADADLSLEEARKHAKDFGFTCPALLDPKMLLARKVGARTKPEAAVLLPKGELAYRGRIDNRYVDFGKRREQVTSRDLKDALEDVLSGKPVRTPRTPAVGCDIDFPGGSE